MLKIKFHSVVSLITNSSTVIFTYQDGSIAPAKELINEMLKLSGVEDKTADDVFYFGVFCDDDVYFERDGSLPDDCPELVGRWGTPEYKESETIRNEWFNKLVNSILKDGVEKPEWMKNAENGESSYSDWAPDSYLYLVPKDEKYQVFGDKIRALLNSVSADGGHDG